MKAIIGYIKEISYGTVQIDVPDDATEKEIRDAILNNANEGGVYYTSSTTRITEWEENV